MAAKKKTTRKKATTKRRRSTTKKPALCRKIDELNAVANKALRSAETMAKKAKTAKDARMKRSYNYGSKQMLVVAQKAQRKAAQLMASKAK